MRNTKKKIKQPRNLSVWIRIRRSMNAGLAPRPVTLRATRPQFFGTPPATPGRLARHASPSTANCAREWLINRFFPTVRSADFLR